MRDRLAQSGLRRGGDSPAAGQRLDGLVRVIGLQPRPQVTDLRGAVTAAAIDLAVDDEPAADAGADRHIEHDLPTAPAPKRASARQAASQSFSITAGTASVWRHQSTSGEAIPAADVMALDDGAGRGVDRSAETEARGGDTVPRDQCPAGFGDLLEDALGAAASAGRRNARARPAAHRRGPRRAGVLCRRFRCRETWEKKCGQEAVVSGGRAGSAR